MSRRILLADDSVTIQKVIELTFMDDDYEVRAVGNGDEALAMLTALTVDFVIADVHMPGASGYEVCRRSKELRPEVPVLLLVGTFEPFDEVQARASGADAFLKKPFDSQELLGRVHDLLGGASAAAGASHPEGVPETPETPKPPATPATPATPASDTSAAAGAPGATVTAGPEARLTGEIEAAATWQEFELEAEPELIPDPWSDQPPPSPAAASVPAAVRHDEHTFALGDLDEQEAPAAAESSDRAFTLGEPLDDHVLLDEAMAQEKEEEKAWQAAPAAASSAGDAQALRATRAEPVSMLGAAALASRPAARPLATPEIPALPETPALPATPEVPERAGASLGQDAGFGSPGQAGETGATAATADAGDAEQRVAAGNGQPAAPPAAAAVLGDQDVDRIARRVVELIGDKVVRDIAWEVIPDLAEVVIKDRLRELESQIE